MRKTEGTSILSLHPGAKAGCTTSRTGKCKDCPLYRFVETEHPQTGENVREWDCIFVWQVMFGGDTSRRVIDTQKAINTQTTLQAKGHQQFLSIVERAQNRRLADASGQD